VYFKHPITIIGVILLQVTLSSVYMFIVSLTPWAPLVLFLIFAGGLIVLFIYITRLSSNEKLSTIRNTPTKFIWLFIVSILTTIFIKTYQVTIPEQPVIIKSLNKIFSSSATYLVVALILYLLLIIIIVTALVESNEGTLRQSFSKYDKHS